MILLHYSNEILAEKCENNVTMQTILSIKLDCFIYAKYHFYLIFRWNGSWACFCEIQPLTFDRNTSNVCGMHLRTSVTVCNSESVLGAQACGVKHWRAQSEWSLQALYLNVSESERLSKNKLNIWMVLHILIPNFLIKACLRKMLILHFNPSSPSLLILHFAGTVRLPFSQP